MSKSDPTLINYNVLKGREADKNTKYDCIPNRNYCQLFPTLFFSLSLILANGTNRNSMNIYAEPPIGTIFKWWRYYKMFDKKITFENNSQLHIRLPRLYIILRALGSLLSRNFNQRKSKIKSFSHSSNGVNIKHVLLIIFFSYSFLLILIFNICFANSWASFHVWLKHLDYFLPNIMYGML